MDRTKYAHKPIDLATDAIRLLRIQKDEYNSPLRCELFESYLDRDLGVPYEALSYAWGDLSIDKIPLDLVSEDTETTSSLDIYPNLYEILRHLRYRDGDRVLWVDAVCIDQGKDDVSLKERTHQVGQMRLVYERAEKVIAWLGESTPLIIVLMEFAQQLDSQTSPTAARSLGKIAWEVQVQELMLVRRLRGIEETQYHDMSCAMNQLLQSPWFQRTWIIQEVASARSGVVMCGRAGSSVSVSMRTFAQLPALMSWKINQSVQPILDIMPLTGQQRKGWWNEQHNLKMLLMKFKDTVCSDPRDSVYALLGICSDAEVREILKPDYEVAPEVLFRNTLSYLLFSKVVDQKTCKLPENYRTTAGLLCAIEHPHGPLAWTLNWACSIGSDTALRYLLDTGGFNGTVKQGRQVKVGDLHLLEEQGSSAIIWLGYGSCPRNHDIDPWAHNTELSPFRLSLQVVKVLLVQRGGTYCYHSSIPMLVVEVSPSYEEGGIMNTSDGQRFPLLIVVAADRSTVFVRRIAKQQGRHPDDTDLTQDLQTLIPFCWGVIESCKPQSTTPPDALFQEMCTCMKSNLCDYITVEEGLDWAVQNGLTDVSRLLRNNMILNNLGVDMNQKGGWSEWTDDISI